MSEEICIPCVIIGLMLAAEVAKAPTMNPEADAIAYKQAEQAKNITIAGALIFPLAEVVLAEALAAGELPFYRAMSNAEYSVLEANGGLTYMANRELFVSSSEAYSRAYLEKSGYDVLVQFNMKPGALNYFSEVGVFHRTAAGSSGWAARGHLMWKSEQGVMNLGIQQNTNMFNPWILNFKKIP